MTLLALGCGGGGNTAQATPPCDQTCKDTIALRALRETLKLAFNLTLQGKPVGTHDESAPCPLGGRVRVFGDAASNAVQGSTEVKLTYVLDQCGYLQKDEQAKENYSLVLTGTITQEGVLAVQPTSTTALRFASEAMTFAGTVYAPALEYQESGCNLTLGQNGNQLSGKMCSREAGLSL